jgi:Transposase C of IS166 homeodomain
MSCEVLELPSDAQEIVALLTEKDREIARLTRETERQQARLQALQEQFNLLIAKRFGRSSEKRSADQLWLFNEAEATAPCDPEPEAVISVPAHRRVRPGRKPLPAALPRIEVIHELPAEERICTHDGEALVEIGEEISEQPELQGRNAFGRYRKNSTSSRHRSGSFGTYGKIRLSALPNGRQDRSAPAPTAAKKHGLARALGAYRGREVPGCPAPPSAGAHPEAHRDRSASRYSCRQG